MKTPRISAKAVIALAIYVVVPAFAIVLTMMNYPEVSRDGLVRMIAWTAPLGLVLVVMSQLGTRYEKGTKEHLVTDLAYTAVALLWVVALLGGRPSITQTWNGYEFTIHLWKKLLIIFAVAGVNAAYFVLVYQAHSEEEETVCKVKDEAKTTIETPAKTLA